MPDNIQPIQPKIIEPLNIKAKTYTDEELRFATGSFVADRLASAFGIRQANDTAEGIQELNRDMTVFINAYSSDSRFYVYDDPNTGKMLIPNNPVFNGSRLGANNSVYLKDGKEKAEVSWKKIDELVQTNKLKTLIGKYRTELVSDNPNPQNNVMDRIAADLKKQGYLEY